MLDKRDFRVSINLNFPLEAEAEARKLEKYAKALVKYAVNINKGQPNEEIGYVELRLSGHRLHNIADEVVSKVVVK